MRIRRKIIGGQGKGEIMKDKMEIKKRKKEEKGFESKKEEKKVIEKEKIGKKRKDKIIERIVEI